MKISQIKNNTQYSINTFNNIKKLVLSSIIEKVENTKKLIKESKKIIIAVSAYANSIGNDNISTENPENINFDEFKFTLKDFKDSISGSVQNKMDIFKDSTKQMSKIIDEVIEVATDKSTVKFFENEKVFEKLEKFIESQNITLEKLKTIDSSDIEKLNHQIKTYSKKAIKNINIEDEVLKFVRSNEKEYITPAKISNVNKLVENTLKKITSKIEEINIDNFEFNKIIDSKDQIFKDGKSMELKLRSFDIDSFVDKINTDLDLVQSMDFGEIIINKVDKSLKILKISIDEITGEIYDKKITILE